MRGLPGGQEWLHASSRKQNQALKWFACGGRPLEEGHPVSSTGAVRTPNRKDGHYQVKDQLASGTGTTSWALESLTAMAKGKQMWKVVSFSVCLFKATNSSMKKKKSVFKNYESL